MQLLFFYPKPIFSVNSKQKFFSTTKKLTETIAGQKKVMSRYEEELALVPEKLRFLYEKLPKNVRKQFLINYGVQIPESKQHLFPPYGQQKDKNKKIYNLNENSENFNVSALDIKSNLHNNNFSLNKKFSKEKKIVYQRPKIQKESGLRGKLDLQLTPEDYASKFYIKNLDKINRRVEHRRRLNDDPVSIEHERNKRLEEVINKIKLAKFDRIVKNDQQTMKLRQIWKKRPFHLNPKRVKILRTNAYKVGLISNFLKKKINKSSFSFWKKKKKFNFNKKGLKPLKEKFRFLPTRLKRIKKRSFSFKAAQYFLITPRGKKLNIYKWQLYRLYKKYLKKIRYSSIKKLYSRKTNLLKDTVRRRRKTLFISHYWKKVGKIGRLRYKLFKKKTFKGPRPRYNTAKNRKVYSFVFLNNNLRSDRKWVKLNFLFWCLFKSIFFFSSKSKLKKLKNKSKNFHDFISLVESRLFSVLLRSFAPNASLASILLKGGLVKVNGYVVKDSNYLLSSLDHIALDWRKLYVLLGLRAYYLLSKNFKKRRTIRDVWKFAVFGKKKKKKFIQK